MRIQISGHSDSIRPLTLWAMIPTMPTVSSIEAIHLRLLFVFVFLPAVVGANDFLKTISLEGFRTIYGDLERENLALIQTTGNSGVVSNVFPVYMAGYMHSTSAIPILLERLEWPGANEPVKMYGRASGDSPINDFHEIRIGLASRLPQPPTPAVGALTQIPIPWETIRQELECSQSATRRQELLAWVASVRAPDAFASWLANALQADSNRWGYVASYAATNLVGRKPFYMGSYSTCRDFCCMEAKVLYDDCVAELRRRAQDNLSQTDLEAIVAILSTMGQPMEEPSINQIFQAVELLPSIEHPNGIPDIRGLIEDGGGQ